MSHLEAAESCVAAVSADKAELLSAVEGHVSEEGRLREMLKAAESCVAAVSTEKTELASVLQSSYLVLEIISTPS